jgi:hypothetical protein
LRQNKSERGTQVRNRSTDHFVWLPVRFGCVLFILLSVTAATVRPALAQPELKIDSSISEVEAPDLFVMNHLNVKILPTTQFYVRNGKTATHITPMNVPFRADWLVRVIGVRNPVTNNFDASAIYINVKDMQGRDWEQPAADTGSGGRFSETGVITKVAETGPTSNFEADGFRVRIIPSSQVSFRGSLHSLADVRPGTWVHFAGRLISEGVLVASQVIFLTPNLPPLAPALANDDSPQQNESRRHVTLSIVSEDGELGEFEGKFKPDQMKGWHLLTADSSVQERARAIGTRLIPEYQNQLPLNDPSKITYRFFVVEEPYIRTCIIGKLGIILVPRAILDRLKGDDQLAAVLADGIASHFQLQRAQMPTVTSFDEISSLAGVASVFAFETTTVIGGGIVKGVIDHEAEIRLEAERARIALQLLDNAGYDPRQAPEAWRLLGPNKLPKDLSKLEAPRLSRVEAGILHTQYPQSPRVVPAAQQFANPSATQM